ncbi:MAG: hypothetical protein Aurels2KO_51530 [Aureliella sp.]
MGSTIDSIKTLNASVRTLLLAILIGTIGYGIYLVYSEYTKQDRLVQNQEEEIREAKAQLEELQGELAEKAVEIKSLNTAIEKLETSMHLLKTDQRLAQLRVVKIERDEEGAAVRSTLQFIELSPQGDPMSEPKEFSLPGDVIYIDNWVIKFDDSYIERGDIERGTSLCLFRRIFSEQQIPRDGFPLDEVGMRPQAYARGGAMSEFEQKLWSDFWEFANDSEKAAEMGIRAANGEAVSIKVREGALYNVSLRASGGLSINPIEAVHDPSKPAG